MICDLCKKTIKKGQRYVRLEADGETFFLHDYCWFKVKDLIDSGGNVMRLDVLSTECLAVGDKRRC